MSTKPSTSRQIEIDKSLLKKNIVTKINNAQRQLRIKDRSMKNITKLLKGTPRISKGFRTIKPKSSSGFKLDDITNIPLTKPITIKPTKTRIIKNRKLHQIEPKPVLKVPPKKVKEVPVKEVTLKPVTEVPSEPIIEVTDTPNINTIKPQITIRHVKRRKNNILEEQVNQDKRKVVHKNNWLKPKHEYKTVCRVDGVVKRKLYVPKQGVEQSQPKHRVPPSVSRDLDVKELVRLADDEGLDDDDFMEILTCPSPVWWENTSDDEYFEDAIPLQIAVDTRFIIEELKNKETEQITNDKLPLLDVKINKSDQNFMQKRSKLEKLLGNMKSSLNLPPKDNICVDINNSNSKEPNKEHNIITDLGSTEEVAIILNDDADVEVIETNQNDLTSNKLEKDSNSVITINNKNKKGNKEEIINSCNEIDIIDISNDNDQTAINKETVKNENNHQNNKNLNKDPELIHIVNIVNSDSSIDVEFNKDNNNLKTNNAFANSDEIHVTDSDVLNNSDTSEKTDKIKTDERSSISSDDMIYEEFPDEMLNDLENVNIPIENNKEIIEIIDDDIRDDHSLSSKCSTESTTSESSTDNVDNIESNKVIDIQDTKDDKQNDSDKIKIKIKDTYKELMKNMTNNYNSYDEKSVNT